MNDDDAVRFGNFPAVVPYRIRKKGVLKDLAAGKQRVEVFPVEVVKTDPMPVFFEPPDRGPGDGMIEAPAVGMGENDRYVQFHESPPDVVVFLYLEDV